jgi:zinc/manganese transport system substrate-binding protein
MRKGVLVATMLWLALGGFSQSALAGDKIALVAAENFYGDVAQQIGGDRVAVTSILANPDQDPHLFETSPTTVRQVAAADIVLYNGADYDPWMDRLLAAAPRSGRRAIVAAALMHAAAGANPHLWYDPRTMPAVARALTDALSALDPAHQDDYAARLQSFLASLGPLNDKIAEIAGKYGGAAVAATEPVFGYMAEALHLAMRDSRFQLAIMNDTEPSARDLAQIERDLTARNVRVLFYNKQASNAVVGRLVDVARSAGVAVVGVTETAPPGLSYQQWMRGELDDTEQALGRPQS